MRPVCFLFAAVTLPCAAADPSLSRIQQQIQFVSHATDGIVGVSATHIETGRTVSVRGEEGFPMASAFKVPVAVQIMTMVDAGQLTLDQMVSLTPQDLHPGSGKLSDLLFHPGVVLSIENLMELMLVISDNSAADIMLREAGGGEAVTARMRALGLPGIRIDRSTALLISDWTGAKNIPPETEWNRDMWKSLYSAVPNGEHMQARRAQMKDPRDTSTPDDMTKLLVHIWRKDLFSPANAEVLLGMLERCQTGKARIKGMLPEGTDVAHKTGTLGGVANDVGVITLPGGLGHVAISVFTKASTKSEDAEEKAVAEVARTVYDYFVLFPRGIPQLMADCWDSALYDDRHSFVWKKSADLIDLLAPQPGERILDLGCGTGHLTAQIAGRGAEVIGIDSSVSMIAQARQNFPKLKFQLADARTFAFDTRFDAVFSNAALHWITEADRVIESIARALRPEGRFIMEMGGKGNIARVVAGVEAVLLEHGYPARNPWFFPSLAEYATLLEQHGFEVREAQTFPRWNKLEHPERGLREWLEMFAGKYFETVPNAQRETLTQAIEARLKPVLFREGAWWADYRRLRVAAGLGTPVVHFGHNVGQI